MEDPTLLRELASRIASDTRTDVQAIKRRFARELGLPAVPRNSAILSAADPADYPALRRRLLVKPTRTLSGVAPVAVMTSPAPCPHGRCLPCPGGPDHPFASPQSYTGEEPAARRAREHDYDPYAQVAARLEHYVLLGHHVDKAELIVMGGTITAREPEYQAWFVGRCLAAMNDRGTGSVSAGADPGLEAARNESAAVRCVALTFETRPDCATRDGIDRMLDLGVTKVELGVQHLSDEVLAYIRRGHTVAETVRANTELRDAGLKVGFHMMPNLPGSPLELDRATYRQLFDDPRFRPDFLKLYPTLVTPGAELEALYRSGEYAPFEEETLVDILAEIKGGLPEYVRLQRIQRDIPAKLIVAGSRHSNFRQLCQQRLAAMGGRCRCIRCREAGLLHVTHADVSLRRETYRAAGAEEHFLSFEGQDGTLVGFLRLRLSELARVRELHVYGPMLPIGSRAEGWQHRGFGERLVQSAEELARDAGYTSLQITSGIGARGYYRRLGYGLAGPYMAKGLADAEVCSTGKEIEGRGVHHNR